MYLSLPFSLSRSPLFFSLSLPYLAGGKVHVEQDERAVQNHEMSPLTWEVLTFLSVLKARRVRKRRGGGGRGTKRVKAGYWNEPKHQDRVVSQCYTQCDCCIQWASIVIEQMNNNRRSGILVYCHTECIKCSEYRIFQVALSKWLFFIWLLIWKFNSLQHQQYWLTCSSFAKLIRPRYFLQEEIQITQGQN